MKLFYWVIYNRFRIWSHIRIRKSGATSDSYSKMSSKIYIIFFSFMATAYSCVHNENTRKSRMRSLARRSAKCGLRSGEFETQTHDLSGPGDNDRRTHWTQCQNRPFVALRVDWRCRGLIFRVFGDASTFRNNSFGSEGGTRANVASPKTRISSENRPTTRQTFYRRASSVGYGRTLRRPLSMGRAWMGAHLSPRTSVAYAVLFSRLTLFTLAACMCV